jgi:3-oxoacyl-(acyl-carrier-protein) synthase
MSATVTHIPLTEAVVITGIGMVTPLGFDAEGVLEKIKTGASAIAAPRTFDAGPFACPVCAAIADFRPQDFIAEAKLLRLMGRDAQLAVSAAHLALRDAGMETVRFYPPGDIGLFGATGMAGLPIREIEPLLMASSDAAGRFDLEKFGEAGLRAVSPILSFKILGNMPVCFVSICENIQGPNAVYTPWEGHGARAIEAGILALQAGDARCVLAGACDVKTHELAFLALEQLGLFDSWRHSGIGPAPGEGAVFLVLETEAAALDRGARIHARIAAWNFQCQHGPPQTEVLENVLNALAPHQAGALIAAANSDPALDLAEAGALARLAVQAPLVLRPKQQLGDLFATAAPMQVALAALLARQLEHPVLAHCFGHGTQQAAFRLDPPCASSKIPISDSSLIQSKSPLMSPHEPFIRAAGIPLQTHLAELRSRCKAAASLQGGTAYFHEELGIFLRYAEERCLFIESAPTELNRPPEEEGNEHQVWHLPDANCFLKATWPDFFGLLVIHRPNEEPKASPIAYLERWHLHNEIFGDDVHFLGALHTDHGLRLLVRQPAIAGRPATHEQIQQFFLDHGWFRFVIEGNVAFFDPQKQVVISDTHRGNLILMDDGLLAPIDLRVQRVSGALLDSVTKLCSIPTPAL